MQTHTLSQTMTCLLKCTYLWTLLDYIIVFFHSSMDVKL